MKEISDEVASALYQEWANDSDSASAFKLISKAWRKGFEEGQLAQKEEGK